MTEGAFADFVRVRWGDLEPAARLVVLDPGTAREVTTTALARLRTQWSGSDGEAPARPVESARRHVLAAAVARAAASDAPAPPEPPAAAPEDGSGTADPGVDPVVRALVAHLHRLEPRDRALLAGRLLWDAGPEEVARLLDRPAPDLRARDRALSDGLAAAHTAARGGDGPAPWALDGDLADAVDVVLHDLSDPPDPAALVEDRARRVRRRSLVLGGVSGLAVLGAGAAVASRETPVAATARPRPLPGPDDRVWLSTSQWPARGPLSADPGLRGLLSRRMSPGDRILWAGDAGTRRLVIAWSPPGDGFVGGTDVRLFTGARGTAPDSLDEVREAVRSVPSVDSVAVLLPDGPEASTSRSLLVVLAKPTVDTGSYSPFIRPTASGDVRRSWTDVALDAGVCTTPLPMAVTPAFRVRVDGSEGPAAGIEAGFRLYTDLASGGADVAASFEDVIAAFTGISTDALTTTVTSTDALDGGLFDEPGAPRGPNGARVVVLRTTTPDGAVVRSSAYVDERGSAFPLETAVVMPAEVADVPWVGQAPDPRPGVGAWLVIHPSADTVQLIGAGGDAGPASPRVRARGRHATVVTAENPGRYGEMRVVLRDARGRRTYDAVPPVGRYLFDG